MTEGGNLGHAGDFEQSGNGVGSQKSVLSNKSAESGKSDEFEKADRADKSVEGLDSTSSEPKTTPVRPAHLFDQAALEQYLANVLSDFAGPMAVTQFAAGQSNPTFLLSTPAAKYVLRKKPPGELLPSAHQVEREYKVMAALRQTDVAVPEVLNLCQDASVIGTNFFVMRYVEGRIFSHPSLPGESKEERAAIYDAASNMMARLHRVNVEAVGLADYGRQESFVSRQLARWTKQYMASKTETIEEMDRVIEWLSANIPASDSKGEDATLIHGDYRLDNMVFHPRKAEILAVLDWELSTLGNPLSDLGYFSMLYHLPGNTTGVPGLGGLSLSELGIPCENEFANSYRHNMRLITDAAGAASGAKDGAATGGANAPGAKFGESGEQRYFVIFSLFRLVAIAQGVYFRHKQGIASAANAESVGRMAKPCAQLAWNLVKQ